MLIPEISRRLEGLLNKVEERKLLKPLKINILRYEVRDAHKKVIEFMQHTIRDQVQNAYWEDMINQMKPNQVFLTVDWAMKLLPKKYRESTKDW